MTARPLPALGWVVQPAYLVVEVVVALRAVGAGSYAVARDSVSALGVACGGGGVCSPWSPAMNTAFAAFGVLVVLGAALARSSGATRRGTLATVLWVVAGLSSVAVALAPLDRDVTTHVVAAAPVFLAQPVAIALHASASRGPWRWLGWTTAVVCGVAALAFVLGIGGEDVSGAAERVALWPVKVWLGLVGWQALRRLRPR